LTFRFSYSTIYYTLGEAVMAKIKSRCTVDNVLDKLSKSWTCEIEISEGLISVQPIGYNKWYPMILNKDRVFVRNLKNALYNIGIYNELDAESNDTGDILTFYGANIERTTT